MKHFFTTSLALALGGAALLAALPAGAQVVGSTTGVFDSYVAGADNPTPDTTGLNTSTFTFGQASSSTTVPNQFRFSGANFNTGFNTPFEVGTFTYQNGTTTVGTGVDDVDLKTTLAFSSPAGLSSQTPSFGYNIPVTITPNTNDPFTSADYITLPGSQPASVFTYNGTTYTLQLTGFDLNTLNPMDGFLTNNNSVLHVYEGRTASANIYGILTKYTPAAVPEASTLAFVGLGLAGLALCARRRKQTA